MMIIEPAKLSITAPSSSGKRWYGSLRVKESVRGRENAHSTLLNPPLKIYALAPLSNNPVLTFSAQTARAPEPDTRPAIESERTKSDAGNYRSLPTTTKVASPAAHTPERDL